ncbi:TPA: AAA family ATPase [Legionella pneumophila]|uniref:AAA family ATPase n=1 Tax=Legionella pneumophila TaxID=446 RepID=UPI00077C9C80|nr:AAA family ATPase [Legionella pneumophila]AMQ26602.1 ATPase AAA [Legionella pneumophila subsp. pneumophila]PQM73261.1 AAA family ATPase [Legionella pneumophila]HAT3844068.1 AAA family ATPase [Legionella pneumophila]HAU0296754.1 AAA family ATPase [Legionella pneumophila]HAU0298669.1 AAA family ATPase [Legionella pneumophila]
MIESLSISKVATYDEQAQSLSGLSKFNFIFGSNGTGKTTISRVIADPEGYEHCTTKWTSNTKLQTLVYNRDFIDSNFNPSTEIKGVFTLGKENIELQSEILRAKSDVEELRKQITTLKKTLEGEDGQSGKKGELETLEENFKNKCWIQKQKYDDKLQGAFKGYRNDKDKFKDKVIQEWKENTATLQPLADLEKNAEPIFGETPNKEILIPNVNATTLIEYEASSILSKRVLGKEDVDIAGMIRKLGNSDWVRQGRLFYEKNEGVCPFCQQKTNDVFTKSLTEYFDETFEKDTKAIDDLEANYKSQATRLQQEITEIISKPYRFLNIEKLTLEKQLLDKTINGNLQKLANKKKEPSQLVKLDSISDIIKAIDTLIDEANTSITQHNTTVDNITQERKTLTAQVWMFVVEQLKIDLTDYQSRKTALDTAIASITTQISTKITEVHGKEQEIKTLEKQTTSIQPTINDMNALLKSFGFHGFSLAPAESDQHYKLIRSNGEDAKASLSEGERNFVTFLYFYHLLKGSHSESGMTNNRVVVFDDPVSSLDSDILFIVSSLIKGLFDDVKKGIGYIKQIFVLTHNVYFHKEVSYNPKRPIDGILKDETFWIVRKEGLQSKILNQLSNPIKTSYELLWQEIKTCPTSSLTIQNTLRRILENYFKILGGIDPNDICEKFEGKNKLVCKSLFSWVNDGSHSAHDDIYVSNSDTTTTNYLQIFKEIFNQSGHIAHYKMMMGENFGEEELSQ